MLCNFSPLSALRPQRKIKVLFWTVYRGLSTADCKLRIVDCGLLYPASRLTGQLAKLVKQPMLFIKAIFYVFTFSFLIMNFYSKNNEAYGSDKKAKYILLIGASVGNRWHFDELQSRINTKEYAYEYVGVYKFDKSKALKEILNRSVNRPDIIIIKECAAYFPGDLDLYKSLMKSWIEQCLEAKAIPIPTTVVPVTRKHNFITGMKIIIKRVLGRVEKIYGLSRIDGILSYNDWIKDYAKSKDLTVLDLESALHISSDNRYLKNELTSGDGLHLNSKAYELLDHIVIPTLKKVNPVRKF